jgi:hypothetical protein
MLGWMSGVPGWKTSRPSLAVRYLLPRPIELGAQFCPWPNLGSVAFVCTIGMIGRTRKPMSTTKCVCAVMHTEKEGVLTQVRA